MGKDTHFFKCRKFYLWARAIADISQKHNQKEIKFTQIKIHHAQDSTTQTSYHKNLLQRRICFCNIGVIWILMILMAKFDPKNRKWRTCLDLRTSNTENSLARHTHTLTLSHNHTLKLSHKHILTHFCARTLSNIRTDTNHWIQHNHTITNLHTHKNHPKTRYRVAKTHRMP